MFAYYLDLARRGLRRAPGLTAWTLLTLALGIAACMTTLTIYHVLAADPIPTKSERLFYVRLDAQGLERYVPGSPPNQQLTRRDAENLLRDAHAQRQTVSSGGSAMVQRGDDKPRHMDLRFASADFFAMFDAPLAAGRAWSPAEDAAEARVVVLNAASAERLFGSPAKALGQALRLNGTPMQVIGVLAPWQPTPLFFDTTRGAFRGPGELFLPFATAMRAKLDRSGSANCWGDAPVVELTALDTPCDWIQYWVELPSADAAPAFVQYLERYSTQQREAGRFARPPNVRLHGVMDWLAHNQVVPADVKLQLGLAAAFLLVCVLCSVGLQLAKTLRRSNEIGVRRALGATRRDVFAQFIVESLLLGLIGCVLGLLLAWGGLALVRAAGQTDYAQVAVLDVPMLLAAVGVSLAAALLAGVLPALRAAGISPALQIKS